MKIFRLFLLATVSTFALSSCALLKCDRCAKKQAAARERATREYYASLGQPVPPDVEKVISTAPAPAVAE